MQGVLSLSTSNKSISGMPEYQVYYLSETTNPTACVATDGLQVGGFHV
jgi:hypothetical protein